ncbi:MAG: MFS transporter [Marmoricola sp.]
MAGLQSMLADTRPLRVKEFRRLWVASIITVIGAQLTVVSVPAQIYAQTNSSAYVGLTGVFGLVPLVIFGLYGGALADAIDRRLLLQISTMGLIVSSGLLFLQAALRVNSPWVILAIFAVQQAFFAINQPARTALLPRILPKDQLAAANSLSMTVFQGGAIGGPLIGGALIPVFGFSWLYAIDTLTLFATLGAVIALPAMPPHGKSPRAGLASVIDGFRYLGGHPVLMMSFVVDLIAMIFGMPRALFPQIAHVDFGGPTDGGLAFALLFAGIPLGALLGGIFSGWVSRIRRQGLAVVIAIAVWGGAIAVFGLASGSSHGAAGAFLWLALFGLIIGGAADMASAAFRTTMLQTAANEEVRGRLQGVFVVVVAGGPRIADVAHGLAASAVGTTAAAVGGGLLVIVLVVVAAAAVPSFVRYRTDGSR